MTPRGHLLLAALAVAGIVLGSAQADPATPSQVPLEPEIAIQEFKIDRSKSFKHAGIGIYVAGALYDLYTTKRALETGLREANPLLASDDDRKTLATAAVAKIGFGFVIGSVGKRESNKARGAWFLSLGIAQLGYGVANRNATIREREALAAQAAHAAQAAAAPR